MILDRLCYIISFVIGLTLCNTVILPGQSKVNSNSCIFTNPVVKGQDPWVTKKGDYYYYIESREGGLYVSRTKKLTHIKQHERRVWTLPDTGWNQHSLWAPELHFIDGKWYIYYAAGEKSGSPFIYQRSGVLQAKTSDPLGGYLDKGILYTGNSIETGKGNIWSIDLTVLEHENQLYGIWSGWEENEVTDSTPQHLYIAEMENPWTVSSNRVKISSPEEPWETGTELAINEGPQVLKNKENEVFIIYSASESWLPGYNLGQLQLVGDDPMNPDSWEKKGPVLQGTKEVYGAGHASFTTSPDGNEDWIAYHTKVSPEPGWERVVHLQPFSWKNDGTPDFGNPVPAGKTLEKPAGECIRE